MQSCRLMKRVSSALRSCVLAVSLISPRASAQDVAGEAPSARSLARYELLANVAYGAATTEFNDLKLEPYGALFGLDFGYIWPRGLRVGAHVHYGLGRSVSQHYERLVGQAVDFTSQGQSLSGSASVGYDLWLHFLILRYSLDLGITWLRWDFGDLRYSSLGGYSPMQGKQVGFQLAPRVALLWPVGRFECGLGMHYLVQFADEIPSGLLGELLLGIQL
jgi:hypothetical protein